MWHIISDVAIYLIAYFMLIIYSYFCTFFLLLVQSVSLYQSVFKSRVVDQLSLAALPLRPHRFILPYYSQFMLT